MNSFYYHGITDNQLACLESILKSKAILSRSKMNEEMNLISRHDYIGYNGNDYVSICKKFYNNETSDCYEEYIRTNISLIMSDLPNVINTELINLNYNNENYQDYYNRFHNLEVRYSDLTGELQVYKEIPLEYVVAISYPLTMLINDVKNSYMENKQKNKIYHKIVYDYFMLKKLLKEYNFNVPIIDLETNNLVDLKIKKIKCKLIKY